MTLHDIWNKTFLYEILEKSTLNGVDILSLTIFSFFFIIGVLTVITGFKYPLFPKHGTLFESMCMDKGRGHSSGLANFIWGLAAIGLVIKPFIYFTVFGFGIFLLLGIWDFCRR